MFDCMDIILGIVYKIGYQEIYSHIYFYFYLFCFCLVIQVLLEVACFRFMN